MGPGVVRILRREGRTRHSLAALDASNVPHFEQYFLRTVSRKRRVVVTLTTPAVAFYNSSAFLFSFTSRIVNGDLRKFCEQQGDMLQWDQSSKNYIPTLGVSGVDWRFYKSPRPEPYTKYW
jgi:hypothetical protein